MRFGKIEYLNLVIFDVFAKRYSATSNFKSILNLKKSYPSKLNTKFLFNRIDAGFISSIAGMKSHFANKVCMAGIIAQREVWSVLILDLESKSDYQSATSNALCKVLDKHGEVIIGDRALKLFYENRNHNAKILDMAALWYEKYSLPFVFGRMCFNKHGNFYTNLINSFNKKLGRNHKRYKGVKVPHYIIMQYVDRIQISKKFALEYLEKIYYTISKKELIALERFYRCIRLKGLKAPKRF